MTVTLLKICHTPKFCGGERNKKKQKIMNDNKRAGKKTDIDPTVY